MAKREFFGTDGIRGEVGKSLMNPEFVLKLGWAVGQALAEQGYVRPKALLGKDTRRSGYLLESALEAGLTAAGVDVCCLGPMPTPAVAYLTQALRAQVGIVVSASHNFFQDNGIKLFGADGFKLSDELELAIEKWLKQALVTVDSRQIGRASRIEDAPGRYIEFCKSAFPFAMNLNHMKIVVDCAHGATYHVAPRVFYELGAEVVPLSVQPNGFNINLQCGSVYPEQLQQTVKAEKADVGIALDGDGDRLIMVDNQGAVVDGDQLLYVMAKALLRDNHAKGVVGTLMSNRGLEVALQREGLEFRRAAVGDRHVMHMLKNLGWQLGGETSGHLVHLGFTSTGDGIISALQILRVMLLNQQSLRECVAGVIKQPQRLINVPLTKPVDLQQFPVVWEAVADLERQLANRGRILLRASGTEPVIRVMVEGEDASEVDSIAHQLVDCVKQRVVTE